MHNPLSLAPTKGGDTTETPTEENEKGCGAAVMSSALLPALVSGFGMALLRKRKD